MKNQDNLKNEDDLKNTTLKLKTSFKMEKRSKQKIRMTSEKDGHKNEDNLRLLDKNVAGGYFSFSKQNRWPDKKFNLAPDKNSYPLTDQNSNLAENAREAISARLEFLSGAR